MAYTHYTRDERNALQAMEGMGLPKCYEAVILGKHPAASTESYGETEPAAYIPVARPISRVNNGVWRPSRPA
jgi:hypothetical protein